MHLINQVMTSKNIQNIITQKFENLRKIAIFNYLIRIPYPLKKKYNNIIPLNIFQTWHTKNLPPNMAKSVHMLKSNNPAFKHYLYDDDDCRKFIKDNYNSSILNAFDKLVPGAYKADLWRYCVLYKLGGIYIDIKYVPINGFKLINLTEKEHWVLDVDKYGIYNALMVCIPGNQILFRAINQVVENVKNNFYGKNALEPTGPLLLSRYFTQKDRNNFDMKHDFIYSVKNRYIYFNNYIVFKQYDKYLEEQNTYKKKEYYATLWNSRKIYNK